MKSRVAWVIVLFFIIVAALSFKEKMALYAVNKALNKYAPGSVFYTKEFSLWPGYVRLKNFGIKNIKNVSGALSFNGQKALFRFSLFSLNKADVVISSLSYDELGLEDMRIAFSKDKETRLFSSPLDIRRMTYKKAVSKDITGRFRMDPKTLYFDDIVIPIFSGIVRCSGSVPIIGEAIPVVDLELQLEHVDLSDVIEFLEAEKRLQATGAYSGKMNILITGAEITRIEGDLRSEGGGQCTIVNDSPVKRNLLSGNGLNIVVENLKDYHYDIGSAKISNDGQDIKIDFLLEGQAGKRHFEIIWHRSVI
jgi:hypothetical protein